MASVLRFLMVARVSFFRVVRRAGRGLVRVFVSGLAISYYRCVVDASFFVGAREWQAVFRFVSGEGFRFVAVVRFLQAILRAFGGVFAFCCQVRSSTSLSFFRLRLLFV